ncbi:type III pantothenate kinase [Cyclobacterium qasimii]|uniref:Type III pantothenate kinase n=2 Tax=Cyclobacterium qasimii TaxID=1350429 RepID=S7V8Z4_9BACT|nr:type III pantothenate kinase [Cyclobacterium qasimii]EPR66052.1 Pantothenate kinase type III [Cyclobacterium qasimii M12-11B]GEO23866.1 type III pantothenate kinase [Cyclobacterium qasimii]
MKQRHWVVDIGNTRIKIGIFEKGTLLAFRSFSDLEECRHYLVPQEDDRVLFTSVKFSLDALKEVFSFPFLYFDHQTPLEITNAYKTPQTLGLDRLAGVIGGRSFKKDGAVLVIDMGTCITYDFLDIKNNYMGGAISPGLKMRARSMHEFTARLPLVNVGKSEISYLGTSTETCMESGIYHGIAEEIKGFIQKYRQDFGHVEVFICGGDAEIFESLIKDHIFVIPNLVLYGLDRILKHNVEK